MAKRWEPGHQVIHPTSSEIYGIGILIEKVEHLCGPIPPDTDKNWARHVSVWRVYFPQRNEVIRCETGELKRISTENVRLPSNIK